MALGRRLIHVDLFTGAYRVSGRVTTGAGGLLSELNNATTDFLNLDEAYVSRIDEPARLIAHYATVAFCKENIVFAVLQDRRDGTTIGTSHGPSMLARGRPVQAFVTASVFEVSGEIRVEGKAVPSSILVQTQGHYLPVLSAQAAAALVPDIAYQGDLVLVQKAKIALFCIDPHKSSGS
jgi:hypothetical protein